METILPLKAIISILICLFLPQQFQQRTAIDVNHARSAFVPLLEQRLIYPARHPATAYLPLPLAVGHRIEALARLIRLDVADELRDRFGIAGDEDLGFYLKRLLGFRPSLTQITDSYGLHQNKDNMFHASAADS